MAGNTFGRLLRLTTFGESHGPALGGILDGCPAGLELSEADIQRDLDLRKPGQGAAGTTRKEADIVHVLSGLFEGRTTGTPIGFYIANEDQRSRDYGNLASVFRPGHADWTYFCKYCGIRDYRGGGRASGRETACRVAGGAIAKKLLAAVCGTEIHAGCTALGGITIPEEEIDLRHASGRSYFAASERFVGLFDQAVAQARARGDTLGGVVRIVAARVPPGLGEPVFDRLDALLAYALMGVGAVKGVEIGSGFASAASTGAHNNDPLFPGSGAGLSPVFGSNNAGGILGGISTGQDIVLNAAVKPIASIGMEQDTLDLEGRPVKIRVGGRHDLAAIPRVIPVLAAMTALTLADALLLQQRMDILK